jgi:hypothetical protein
MMANLGDILKSIQRVAETVAPLLGPQVAGAAAAAEAIAKLIDDAKAVAGPEHQTTVDDLVKLQTEVGARARATIAGLRGDAGTDTHG